MSAPSTVLVGAGRAGGAFEVALTRAGWDVTVVHHGDLASGQPFASTAELVLLCVPDAAVGPTAALLDPDPARVVAHCAGSLGLGVLAPHPRRASVHPLISIAAPDAGADRLSGAWFAVAGDRLAHQVVQALDGRLVEVDDEQRAAYHAAAAVASNHLVALLGQVERIAASAGIPLEAYADLVAGTIANIFELGPEAALTGPVSRGDWDTVRMHLRAIGPEERAAYLAMAAAAATLVGRELPALGDG